ncbi:MarR family winged helix-turn-helix transcriptional regulator [Roseibium sp.]|uniref:MarR family winged helix-turn-helix transcriptional regulator n=1 Tax=Roseibium sp. TaxID=1936156 RepID=UPI003A9765EC
MTDPKTGSQNEPEGHDDELLPFEKSIGYQIRTTNRLMTRYLQQKITPHGVTIGMWYFLRVLWRQDGLTQRELSHIVGTMEPTTLTAIKSMERKGLVRRVKNGTDRRKINIYLTEQGSALRDELIPLAKEVVDDAVEGFSDRERAVFLEFLAAIQNNLTGRIEGDTATDVNPTAP